MTDPLVPRTDGRVLQDAVALLREARDDIAFHLRDGSDEVSSDMLHKIDSFLAAPEAGKEHWARDLEVNTSASTVARQPAAGSVMAALEEPTMPMLPNQYHPGPRCSCRECLVTFPFSKFTAAPQECAPVMGAVGNSSSPPCETDVKPAVAACLIRYPDAEKLDSEREAAVTAMDQEIEALKHDNERLVRTNADLASEQHVPAAVVEFVNGKASVILDSKFLSGLTDGSHVLYAAPQEHDAISGSYAPTRPAVAALGKRIDEEPITHGTPSPTEVHPPVLEPITQTWAGKEPSEAAIALFDYLENRPSTDCEWTKGYN